jgi:hypothetical protein
MRVLGIAVILAALVGAAIAGLMEITVTYNWTYTGEARESTVDCGAALNPAAFGEDYAERVKTTACAGPIRQRRVLVGGVTAVWVLVGTGLIIGGRGRRHAPSTPAS